MTTGTIQSAVVVILKDQMYGVLTPSFVNGSGAELKVGQEVKLKTDGTLDKRSALTDVIIGVMEENTADGERGVVRVAFKEIVTGQAKGGTLDPGTLVSQDGTLGTDNRPNYIANTTSTYATGIVINGGTVGTEILVGELQSPTQMI